MGGSRAFKNIQPTVRQYSSIYAVAVLVSGAEHIAYNESLVIKNECKIVTEFHSKRTISVSIINTNWSVLLRGRMAVNSEKQSGDYFNLKARVTYSSVVFTGLQ
jgi:hypothetical protein